MQRIPSLPKKKQTTSKPPQEMPQRVVAATPPKLGDSGGSRAGFKEEGNLE